MFVENYRQENAESIMAGGDARPIPYPKISAEDWRVWNVFLPVRVMDMDREAVCRETSLHHFYGIPYALTGEIQKASEYFDKVEVWRKTDINIPLEYLSNVIKKKCIAFVLSDFISKNFESTLRIASRRHDVIGIHVHDPAESVLPEAGLIRMRDAESGNTMLIDTSDPIVRHAYAVSYAQRVLDFKEQFKRNQTDTMSLSTDQSYIQELHKFFKHRAS